LEQLPNQNTSIDQMNNVVVAVVFDVVDAVFAAVVVNIRIQLV
jgi:hypothetical protein